jgi:hypothetical protein
MKLVIKDIVVVAVIVVVNIIKRIRGGIISNIIFILNRLKIRVISIRRRISS